MTPTWVTPQTLVNNSEKLFLKDSENFVVWAAYKVTSEEASKVFASDYGKKSLEKSAQIFGAS